MCGNDQGSVYVFDVCGKSLLAFLETQTPVCVFVQLLCLHFDWVGGFSIKDAYATDLQGKVVSCDLSLLHGVCVVASSRRTISLYTVEFVLGTLWNNFTSIFLMFRHSFLCAIFADFELGKVNGAARSM